MPISYPYNRAADHEVWLLPDLMVKHGVVNNVELAKLLKSVGFERSAVYAWRLANGRFAKIGLSELRALCRAFKVTIGELIAIDETRFRSDQRSQQQTKVPSKPYNPRARRSSRARSIINEPTDSNSFAVRNVTPDTVSVEPVKPKKK